MWTQCLFTGVFWVFASPKMPSLLGLPRDIRDDILSYALRIKEDPPASPAEIRPSSRVYLPASEHDFGMRRRFRFQLRPTMRLYRTLQLVSRQVYHEVRDVMRREARQPPNLDLDIMYLKDGSIWTTWTRLPYIPHRVNTVYITFRIFKCPAELRQTSLASRIFLGANCAMPAFVWLFYLVLRTFLTRGAFPLLEDDGPGMVVSKIIIDVLSATEPDIMPLEYPLSNPANHVCSFEDFFQSYLMLDDESDNLSEGDQAAAQFARFLQHELTRLAGLDYRQNQVANVLYDRVGAVDVRLNGEPLQYFDLAEIPYRESYGSVRWVSDARDYARWVARTITARRRIGLPVAPLREPLFMLLVQALSRRRRRQFLP